VWCFGFLCFWTFPIVSYSLNRTTYWKLALFPFSGQQVRRNLLGCVSQEQSLYKLCHSIGTRELLNNTQVASDVNNWSGPVCQWIIALPPVNYQWSYSTSGRLRLKFDGTCAETRFRLSAQGTSPFNRRGSQFSRLQAAEVCASALVMLDTPCSEVVWRVLATHSIRQFPLHFLSRASPCAITFQLESTSTVPMYHHCVCRDSCTVLIFECNVGN
jgi:hypothetical protein